MSISTDPKPTIYRNLYEDEVPLSAVQRQITATWKVSSYCCLPLHCNTPSCAYEAVKYTFDRVRVPIMVILNYTITTRYLKGLWSIHSSGKNVLREITTTTVLTQNICGPSCRACAPASGSSMRRDIWVRYLCALDRNESRVQEGTGASQPKARAA